MIAIDERKFAVSDEVQKLWKELQVTGRENELQERLMETTQGQAIAKTIASKNQTILQCSMERRGVDNSDTLYIKVRPIS